MGKKIKIPNYALKILSVLIAIGLWMYVSYAESPKTEYWYRNVPITYVNDFPNSSDFIRVTDNEIKTVSVKVRGTRSAILGLTENDITAKADVSSITETGNHNISYSISFPIDGFEILDKSPYNIPVDIEKRISKQVSLEVINEGTLPEGYILQEISASKEYIEISGPENLVNNVSSCRAIADIDGQKASDSISREVKVMLNDGFYYQGNDLRLSDKHVFIKTLIYCEKEMSVNVKVSDDSALENMKISAEPDKVILVGPVNIIEKMDRIDTETVYIYNDTDKVTADLDIPEDVYVKDNKKTITVKAERKE